jgi:hypothetical protein
MKCVFNAVHDELRRESREYDAQHPRDHDVSGTSEDASEISSEEKRQRRNARVCHNYEK